MSKINERKIVEVSFEPIDTDIAEGRAEQALCALELAVEVLKQVHPTGGQSLPVIA